MQQVGMFTDPAQSGLFSDGFFQDRRRIDKHPVAKGPRRTLDLRSQLLQPLAHQFVIVPAQGIAGDIAQIRSVQDLPGIIPGRQIVHTGADDAQGPRHQLGRAAAFAPVFRHIAHLALESIRQPLLEPTLRQAEIDIADAQLLKAQLLPPVPDARNEVGQGRIGRICFHATKVCSREDQHRVEDFDPTLPKYFKLRHR